MTDRELMQQWLDAIAAIPEDVEGYLPDALTDVVIATRERLAQPEQEPVAWCLPSEEGCDSIFRDHSTVAACTGNKWEGFQPLYTAPQPRQWVGLTDEEIMDRWPFESRVEFARWVEAKLREKNT